MTQSIHAAVTKEQFLEAYLKDLSGGGLFLQTNEFFGLGDVLVLRLAVAGLQDVVELHGKVAWHRRPRAWSSTLPSGIGFQFVGSEALKRDFLLAFAAGEVSDRRKTGPRRKSEHETKVKIHDTWVSAKTANVSAGGLLLLTEEKLERGDTVQCVVYLDDSSPPLECNVQIEWVEKEKNQYIVGARFLQAPPKLRNSFVAITNPEPRPPTRAQQILKHSTIPPPPKSTSTIPILKKSE